MNPGERWRFLAWGGSDRIAHSSEDDPSIFDELIVDNWFHIEQMDDAHWWMAISRSDGTQLVIDVTVDPETGTAASVSAWEDR